MQSTRLIGRLSCGLAALRQGVGMLRTADRTTTAERCSMQTLSVELELERSEATSDVEDTEGSSDEPKSACSCSSEASFSQSLLATFGSAAGANAWR